MDAANFSILCCFFIRYVIFLFFFHIFEELFPVFIHHSYQKIHAPLKCCILFGHKFLLPQEIAFFDK